MGNILEVREVRESAGYKSDACVYVETHSVSRHVNFAARSCRSFCIDARENDMVPTSIYIYIYSY